MNIQGAALLGGSSDYVYDEGSGEFINAKFQRIAEVINDWNPEVFLLWIPRNARGAGDTKPYAIQHRPSDGRAPYIIKYLSEEELDHRVIADLWTMGQNTQDLVAYLDKLEAAQEALRLKEQEEELMETFDKMHTILSSPLHTYRLGNGKVIRS